jgi:nitric oxide reductase NorD protein
MKFISNWFKKKTTPTQKTSNFASLESKQTGSCGGMSTTELKIRIELILSGIKIKESIMSSVTKLAKLSHLVQSQFLTQLEETADISMTHAYSLMLVYEPALNEMNTEEHEQWIEQIIQALKSNKTVEANSLIENYSNFSSQINKSIVLFTHVSNILDKLIFSITQQQLTLTSLEPAIEAQPYTDGKSIFLPESISLFDNYQDNYLLYKIIAFQLLGQIECQTNAALKEITEGVSEYGDDFLDRFSTLETLRINQYLKDKFPGMWKKILNIHAKLNIDNYPEHIFHGHEATSVFDSLAWLNKNGLKENIFVSLPYQSNFSPDKLLYVASDEGIKRQPVQMDIYNQDTEIAQEENNSQVPERVYFKHNSNSDSPTSSNQSQSNVWQDLTEKMKHHQQKQQKLRNELKQTVYLYPEWDTSLRQYRTDWCRVEEIPIEENINNEQVLDDPELKFSESRIKRSLDLIINDQKLIRYQSDGDEIDIDAWVSAKSNKSKHADDFQNLYIKNNKNNRSVAIMFAVDISGSTAGWKNKIIKQSTWLLSRTLAKLNDQHAIYAFSGSGREQCNIYPIKKFDESYNDHIKQRILSLEAQQYTRMGAAVRHLTKILKQTDAKTKILFVLTDGKPDDIDSYRGHYGIEDTRHAFNEAKAQYINPFVLTFDKEAMEYLPYMLGKKHFRLISNIAMLPIQISTIYKQLTT